MFRAACFLVIVICLVQLGRAGTCRLDESGYVVFVAVAGEAIDVPSDAVTAAVEAKCGVGPAAVVGGAKLYLAGQRFRPVVGDPAGMDIHHAADRTGAVEQGARPFEHFDPIGDERFDSRGMVGAGGRGVHGVDAVFHDADPGTAHAVDHGTANGLAEGRRVDPGLAAHGIADARPKMALE